MVVYPYDIHKVSRLLTGKKGKLRKEVPSVAMMTNFWIWPIQPFMVCFILFVDLMNGWDLNSGIAGTGTRGAECPLNRKKIAKNQEKEGENQK